MDNDRTEPIRWAVIGCGDVVERKSGPAFQDSERSHVRAVVSTDGTSAEAYASATGVPIATDDAERVITDPDVDAVYIATPPDTHEGYTRVAAEAGKPVLVEKPMGRSVTEAGTMIEHCDRHSVELFVAYYRRFHPHVEKIRELLTAGAIGEPCRAVVDYGHATPAEPGWRERPAVSGGGWFVDAASHRVDLLCYLLGAPTEATGSVRYASGETPTEEIVSLTVVIDGTVCTVTSDFVTGTSSDAFRLFGTEGHIVAETLDDGTLVYETADHTGRLDFEPPEITHEGLLTHVEGALLDGETNRTSGRDALRTEAILDTCVRSGYADAIPTTVQHDGLANVE
ncbi:Gfo/Idh/MocA family protein [Haloarcula marina]|uniref:Gfo/Idh/MocA family protein n=1 Tax=Haloarcula marina TaxID=2961574 RepID=UPI0020B7F24E|nr:Gfo/Idh/MocA family oxidoreductase [Halomicroarcula marina]